MPDGEMVAQQPEAEVSPQMASPQMASPEQKQQLFDTLDKVKQALGSFNAQRFASKNRMAGLNREILRGIFEALQRSGVDLTDRESVAAFLEKLRNFNPNLAEWFESSLDVLLGQEEEGFELPEYVEDEYEKSNVAVTNPPAAESSAPEFAGGIQEAV